MDGLLQIIDIIVDSKGVELMSSFTAAMPGKVESVAIEASLSEPRQKIDVPASGRGIAAVYEK